MLREEDQRQIRERLSTLRDPITLSLFTQQIVGQCRFCAETERLLREVAALSDKIALKVYNFVTDTEIRDRMGIDKIPAIRIHQGGEALTFYGIPTGYEFATFLEAMIGASTGKTGLGAQAKARLEAIPQPVHIQVFVTPTCPYCPQAAVLAFWAALVNPRIRADVIEITEFPHLAQKYGVMGVPKGVVNETVSFEGAIPESLFVEKILQAIPMSSTPPRE